MNGERVEREGVLAQLASLAEAAECAVLTLHDTATPAACPVRALAQRQATHHTQAVTSRLEQLARRKRAPQETWQHIDINNALARQRFSQPGFDVVLLPRPPADPQLWCELLKPGGSLLCEAEDGWRCWRAAQSHHAFPLTDIQHAYWIGRTHTLALGGVSCHVCFEWRLDNFDLPRFERAWNRVIARHGMMRACINEEGLQYILLQVPWYSMAVSDWRDLDAPTQQQRLQEKRQQLSEQVLDASRWPLFDLQATRISNSQTLVHLDLDLLTFDVQSFHIVLAELERNYHHPERPLPALTWTFRDYQLAEARDRLSSAWRQDRDWWRARLADLAPAPHLPLACEPHALAQPRFRRLQRRVEAGRWQQLTQQAAHAGVTPSAMLLAAFSEVLTGWAESPHFTLNLTHFNRHPWHPDVAEMVGDFTAVLLLTLDCARPLPFAERARRIQQAMRERLAHSRFSGVDVLRERAKQQGSSELATMPVVFTSLLGMDLDRLVEGADLLGEPAWLYTATPQVWLDHQVMVRKGTLEYNWIVIDNLFPAGMIDQMFQVYGELLDALCTPSRWQQPVETLLTPAQAQVRQRANATEQTLPLKPLHAGFFEQARQRPEAVALITPQRTLRYGELAQRALQVAAALAPLAVENQPVVLSMPKGADQIIAALGIMAAGAILVPAAHDWPRGRLAEVIGHSQARALIAADASLAPHFPVPLLTLDALPAPLPAPQLPSLDQLAYIIYTSGSTGKPKGVAMQHGATANTLADLSARLRLTADDRVFGLSALSFDLAIFDLFATLGAGAGLVLPESEAQRDAAAWLAMLEQHQVTLWNSVPALMAMLAEQAGDRPLPHLRAVMLSGDWFRPDLAQRIMALAPNARILALGGATEAAIWSNVLEVERCDPAWKSVPYGYPLANQRYYVLDAQRRDRPAWVAGDLCIAGAGLAQGYWRDAARSTEAFVWSERLGQRLYRTGDIARYDAQGCIEFLGRRDAQVKLNGYRIELGEIEQRLLADGTLASAAVDVVRRDSGATQLLAWAVPRALGDDIRHAQCWQAGQRAAQALPAADRIASLAAFQSESESLAPLMMWQLLQQLEIATPEGWQIEEARQRARIDARFSRLLAKWHSLLEEEGILERRGGRWFALACAPDAAALAQRIDDGRVRLARCLAWQPQGETFLHWLFASQQAMAEVLREPRLAASLLFPEGESAASEALYQRHMLADYLGQIAADLLCASLDGQPQPQVLEIGAGIGGLTASTLPAFAGATDGHYFHTDVSPWFTHYAEQRFGESPALRTGRYDINLPLEEQPWQAEQFNAVLAANVLHNAHQLDRTLTDIWRLLKPGGSLIVLEATQDKALQWVTAAAVLEHAANEESQRDSPLLPTLAWQQALQRNGFELGGCWPQPGTPLAFGGQQVFIARRPAQAAEVATLIHQLRDALPAYMVPERLMLVPHIPLSPNGKRALAELPRPGSATQQTDHAAVTPLDEAERALAEVWQGLLRSDITDAGQDFFRSGGDSLLATQLATRLSQRYGKKVPIGLIFSHSRLRAMSQALAALSDPALPPPLVSLNAGSTGTLICLHGSDGDCAAWSRVAARLDRVRCVGIQAGGLLAGESPINDLPAQAERARQALHDAGFTAPWHLAGWSMGAALAIEMAWQWQQAGETIASLSLVDPVPPAAMLACATSEYRLWQSMADDTLRAARPDFDHLDPAERLAWWRKVMPAALQGEDALLQRRVDVVRANVQAMCFAPPRTLAGITPRILAASTRAADWGDHFEWLAPHFPQGLAVRVIPDSTHWSVLACPATADALRPPLSPSEKDATHG